MAKPVSPLPSLFEQPDSMPTARLVPTAQASRALSASLKRSITVSNISYLVQYGRIAKHRGKDGSSLVDIDELRQYYRGMEDSRRAKWRGKVPGKVNWNLSFEHCRESETTKHVHRLHPYKGKFIPQLVEYFLDQHTDEFKKKAIFEKGDMVSRSVLRQRHHSGAGIGTGDSRNRNGCIAIQCVHFQCQAEGFLHLGCRTGSQWHTAEISGKLRAARDIGV